MTALRVNHRRLFFVLSGFVSGISLRRASQISTNPKRNLQRKLLQLRNVTLSTQNPVVKSIVSLTSSLVLKMLAVLVSTISNSQVFLLKKNVSSFCSHFFCKNISIYAIFNDETFNDTFTNDSVSFEQLAPG